MGSNTSIVGRLRTRWFYAPRMTVVGIVAMALLLSACGQKGALYLPTDAAAQGRASLPQSMLPASGASAARPTPSASAAR